MAFSSLVYAQSNLLSANDSLNGIDGARITFTYDQENRIKTNTTSNTFGASAENNSFNYVYDALDRRASMMDGFSGITSYRYDPVDRLSRITTPQGDDFTISYDLAGRNLRRAAPNASEIMRSYETVTGRLARHTQSINGSVFNDFAYSYTPRGNIAAIAEEGEITRTRQYSYDAIERLTEVAVPQRPFEAEVYELDAEGNRLSSHLSDLHQTDEANRLTDDDNYTYVYDLNGNLTGKLAKEGTGLTDWSYRYDALDQLIGVAQDGADVETYRYDAFGRRSLIRTEEDAGLTRELGIINQGTDRVLDIANDNAAEPSLTKRYTHSAAVDVPLQLETFEAAGNFEDRYTYHPDHLGSIRYLTDSAGQIVNSYDYDSYGRSQFGVSAIEQPFQYTGREWDAATGLYYYRARAYDADTGRFLQEDPIFFSGRDLNIYRYVGSNPVNKTDPSGLLEGIERLGVTAATGAVFTGAQVGTSLTLGGTALATRLQSKELSTVAAIGGRTSCKFHSVAAALNTLSSADESKCGAQVQEDDLPDDANVSEVLDWLMRDRTKRHRCEIVKEICIEKCVGLVGSSQGRDSFDKCVNECMEDADCLGVITAINIKPGHR